MIRGGAVSAGARPCHVLVTGSNALVRKGAVATLDGHANGQGRFRVVAELSGTESTPVLERHGLDLVLVLGGPDDLPTVPRTRWQAPVLLGLTGTNTMGADVLRGLRGGASGVVSVDTDLDALPVACLTVAQRRAYLSPSVVQALLQHLTGGAVDAAARFDLTVREQEVLRRLADGMSTAEIAEAIGVACRTVKHHLSSVYRKLRVRNACEAVAFAYREGLVV